MLSFIKKFPFFRTPNHFFKMNFASALPKWKYADKAQIYPQEFTEAFDEVSKDDVCPFVVVDVREDLEINTAELPWKNKNGVEIPKLYISMDSLFKDEDSLTEIPQDKYVLCLCHHGVRSAYASQFLKNKGYKSLNIAGGIDKVSDIWTKIPKY